MNDNKENTLCLVDGSGYIFRAFYALPSMNRADGTPVNAVYGFTNMMMNLLQENACAHIVVIFDANRYEKNIDCRPNRLRQIRLESGLGKFNPASGCKTEMGL